MARVLVIDDDPSVGASLQLMLDREGCAATWVPDAHTGIQVFNASRFDLAIVDLLMPVMSGLETIAGFRKRAPAIPVLAMSGFRFSASMGPDLDFFGMATQLGATSCLRKPFAPYQLIAALNAGLGLAFQRDLSPNRELGRG